TVASICNQAAIAIHNAQQYQIQKNLEALKAEFLCTISHELRTPLTSIKGFAETLLKPGMDLPDEARQRILEIISRQADHLSKLIEEILAVSRLEAAKMVLPVSETPLDELIRQILDSLQEALASFEVTTNLAHIVLGVDRNKIAQVLINLIGNATKYTPKGRRIEVTLQKKGEGAVIRVADQGIGIPPESHPALFKKFSRLDNSLTRKTGGTGLGLYISAKLVEAHGGRIWIEDPPWGEGTCFGVFLPGRIS
ncbi:MAG TPA: ATP-binding protein, partial [Chroococcales cyanobacterium]